MTTIPKQPGQQPPRRAPQRAPGILRLLPETLPYYKYKYNAIDKKAGRLRLPSSSRKRKQKRNDLNSVERQQQQHDTGDNDDNNMNNNMNANVIPNMPLRNQNNSAGDSNQSGFTLFFFVDSTNRQSLLALPLVSQWFHHALSSSSATNDDDIDDSNNNNGDTNDDENDENDENNESSIRNNHNDNRIICIPNHPSPREIDIRNSTTDIASDPIVQASIIDSSATSIIAGKKCPTASMLSDTGFYHLPFLHSKRLPLLHMLGVDRVPCVIVVSNADGRIVTRYGWEAIERESGALERWLAASASVGESTNKECDGDGDDGDRGFESEVAKQWSVGNTGLPFWWHLLSWIA